MPGVPAPVGGRGAIPLSPSACSLAFSPNKYFDFYPQSPVFVALN